jgi:hypothetical protein
MIVRGAIATIIVAGVVIAPAFAQPPVTIGADLTFYGDNTEFSNPFRRGETLLGVHGRLFVEADLSERAALRLGVFGNQRFGAEHGFHNVRPVASLVLHGAANQFIFGALDQGAMREGSGPDLDGPHALFPALQRETLAFTRGYEAGLQWIHTSPRLRQDAWINWQQLNTPGQREVFDAGVNGRAPVTSAISAAFQAHIVHHGGQLFHDGPVSDSLAFGPGIVVAHAAGRIERLAGEMFVFGSFYRPDREQPSRDRSGFAGFVRVSGERGGWRGHLLAWRGSDFIKEEGDPNYLSLTRDGRRYRGVRDYAEAGVTRKFAIAPRSDFEVSVRLHRIERRYEYSYRLLARVRGRWPL